MLEPAQLSDWESINTIFQQVHLLHVGWRPDIFRFCTEGFPKDFFQECVEQKTMYVGKLNGTIVGFVQFFIWQTNGSGSVPSKVLDIDSIAVDEAYRHQGIGRQMMEDVKEIAKELGCNDIQLSVYPQNKNAVRFYEKCGFKVRNIKYQMYV